MSFLTRLTRVLGAVFKGCRQLSVIGLGVGLGLGLSAVQMATAQAQGVTAAPAPARQWLSPPPGDAVRGAALYQSQCTACHSVDASKIGPAHRGVVGRRIGSLAGYKYSTELAASRLRWTPQTLFTWLGDPEDLVVGQRMGFAIEDAQQRGDLIAYLATLK